LSLFLVACRGEEAPTEPPALAGNLYIDAPATAVVGETVELLVGPINAADNTPVFLTILGSYGPNVLRAQFEGGMAWFQIPAEMTTRSGTVSLVATAGNARGPRSSMPKVAGWSISQEHR
jgi:hypothetical protein